ncbi:hypothetical protein [Kitasatospora aureofaciens]|uniref:hypothetical protein n=1 Tax=Kitasatospora aureofaciens TaxID=1894 RepID=UPI0037C88673
MARTQAQEYLTATVGTERPQHRTTEVFTEPGNPEAHTPQTLNDATTKLQAIRDDLRAWRHARQGLHDGFRCAPDGGPVHDLLGQAASRFVTTVLHLHEAAASRLLDGPFGPTDKSLQLWFDGARLLTPSGAIPFAGIDLPGATTAMPA